MGDAGPAIPCDEDEVRWTDISTEQIDALGGMAAQSYPGGVSGVVVNRLTGDVTINIVGFGIWRSSDRGESWTRIDGETIDMGGGRSETGWTIQVDQDDPTRMAVFTLDGTAGSTTDGVTWRQWAYSGWGRNWDFGAVDWSSPDALTIFGVLHETSPRDQFAISTDGGRSWSEYGAARVAPTVGVVDSRTLLASRGSGIERSEDLGESWTMVSAVTPQSRVVTRFRDRFYVTAEGGLLVSADRGLTWEEQGTAIEGQMMFQARTSARWSSERSRTRTSSAAARRSTRRSTAARHGRESPASCPPGRGSRSRSRGTGRSPGIPCTTSTTSRR